MKSLQVIPTKVTTWYRNRPVRMYTWKQALQYYLEKVDIVVSKVSTALKKIKFDAPPGEPYRSCSHRRTRMKKDFSLEDFGIRRFCDDDDWILMRKGGRKGKR